MKPAHLLEEHARDEKRLDAVAEAIHGVHDGVAHGQAAEGLADVIAHPTHGGLDETDAEASQVRAEGADVVTDAHLVVVEDDEHVGLGGAGLVEGGEGHASGERAVADDRDDLLVGAAQIAGAGEAEGGGDAGTAVAGAVGIVRALGARGEAAEAAGLADRGEAVAAAGEKLVRVRLVADVPEDLVLGRVVDVVEGDGQLDDAEVWGEVAADLGDGVEDACAHLAGQHG